MDRVRELEAELKAMRLLLQEKEHTLADTQEELAIVKSSAHLQQTKALRFQFVENHRSQFSLEDVHPVTRITERILQVADGSYKQAAAPESRGHEAYSVSFLRPPEAVWKS